MSKDRGESREFYLSSVPYTDIINEGILLRDSISQVLAVPVYFDNIPLAPFQSNKILKATLMMNNLFRLPQCSSLMFFSIVSGDDDLYI